MTERLNVQGSGGEVTAEKLTSFATLMREVLASPDNPVRKAYVRAIISSVEVDETPVRIVASRDVLEAAVSAPREGEKQFVLLYRNGVPETIRTSGLCFRRQGSRIRLWCFSAALRSTNAAPP